MRDKLNDNFGLKNGGYSNYEVTTEMPRHRWYYYKEGFSPNLVEQAIEQTGLSKDDLVIDPFNGSGTTTLTSSILGYRSIGIEVNPFTAFLASAKVESSTTTELLKVEKSLIKASKKGAISPLAGFSTFTKTPKGTKWLFEDTVLNSFEGSWQRTNTLPNKSLRRLARLATISAAMQNCNAIKDGKCLRYRDSWETYGYNQDSFLSSLSQNLLNFRVDIEKHPILERSTILRGDARKVMAASSEIADFKLCITSPPYLNTFDYTDIYRPELFLGKFVKNPKQLYDLRLETVRSHIQAKWRAPKSNNFGLLYKETMEFVKDNEINLMNKSIPVMIQAYFEDMEYILTLLKKRVAKDGQVWLVVANSAYADLEVPVDLIIGDIASRLGWYLREIGVMRYVQKRKTRHSPNVKELRESVIILSNSKP